MTHRAQPDPHTVCRCGHQRMQHTHGGSYCYACHETHGTPFCQQCHAGMRQHIFTESAPAVAAPAEVANVIADPGPAPREEMPGKMPIDRRSLAANPEDP